MGTSTDEGPFNRSILVMLHVWPCGGQYIGDMSLLFLSHFSEKCSHLAWLLNFCVASSLEERFGV